MDIRSDEISELILPESKEKKGYLVYLKIIFIPALLYVFILLGYYDIINFKVELHTVVMIGFIFFTALVFARHSSEYAYSIFEQQKDEFKQALKRHIMKHFLTIGKDTKSNANFDDFAYAYVRGARNENFASIGAAIFPMMGILGTFISIALSMPNFSSSDTAALEQEIALLLSGVGTAFYVSIYGIFLALWWMFFEKFGKSKIERLLNRQKNSTSGFFWTKEELDQRYLSESLQHFEKISTIFKQVSNQDFFAELDHTIDRKFGIFQDMLNVEEKAIRLSGEHIKQTMGELSRAQRDQRDLVRYLQVGYRRRTLSAYGPAQRTGSDRNDDVLEPIDRFSVGCKTGSEPSDERKPACTANREERAFRLRQRRQTVLEDETVPAA